MNLRLAQDLAKKNNWVLRKKLEDGSVMALTGVDQNQSPRYYITHNIKAAQTISTNQLWEGGSLGLSLSGFGMTHTISGNTYGRLAMWDEGAVRRSHIEFNGGDNSVVQRDGALSISSHATHIAGTMVAEGDNVFAKGMAWRAQLEANDWFADESEMAQAASRGLLISNHSYGVLAGWVADGANWVWYGDKSVSLEEDFKFGFYDQQAAAWDQISYNAPYYLIVKSAGNDRGEGPGASPVNAESDGGADGYDCISTYGNAKNVLTVGAVFGLDQAYSGPQDVIMTSFSSWGPTDDGRIKPDLCAGGVAVFSPVSFTNDSYSNLNGTSMATASVSASLLLLQEHYQNLNGNGSFMKSSSLKALAIHTTDEAGLHEGPDYQFGWGLMNTARAAQLISLDRAFENSLIKEEVLDQGQTFTYTIRASGEEDLVLTLAWTDPEATPVSNQLNPSNLMLINDLDIRVSDGSNTYFPYILDPSQPSQAAGKGDNFRDNVEKIYIANPTPGQVYTITISHKGSLKFAQQDFSLILSGVAPQSDFARDASITELRGFNSFGCNRNPDLQFKLLNFGSSPINQLKIYYRVNDEILDSLDWQGEILPGGNRLIALPSLSFGLGQQQSLEVFIGEINGQADQNPINNVIVENFDVDPAITSYPYQESFENGNAGWQIAGTNGNWRRGIPGGVKINTASDGQIAWTINNYNSNQESILSSPVFDLSAISLSEVKVDIFRQTEDEWDGVQLQISTDCGEYWQTLGRKNQGSNWYNNDRSHLPFGEFVREGWTGNLDDNWVTASYSLAAYEGYSQVRFRFIFRSDGSYNEEGFGLDNFRITGSAKMNQQITVNNLPPLTYGDQPQNLNASSSAGLPLSFLSADPAIAEVVNGNLIIKDVGATQITISQSGDAAFEAATPVVVDIVVAKASLMIRPDTLQRRVGEANPTVQISFQGFVNGEDQNSLDELPVASIQANQNSAPGNYEISISGGQDDHYEYLLNPGVIRILPQEISEVRLINGDSEAIIKTIQDGDQIKLAGLADLNLNIQALTNPDLVGSVVFRLFGPLSTTVNENIAPYALFGDLGEDDFQGITWPAGEYTLEIQAYSAKSGQGIKGTLKRLSFELMEESLPSVSRVSLIDTDTDQELFDISDGDQLQAATVKDRKLSFLIRTIPRLIGSLDMELSGPINHQQLENLWPYSLFGDVPGPDYAGQTLLPGSYQLIIKPYSEKNQQGAQGNEQVINFEVLPEFTDSLEALAIDQILLWDADNDTVIGPIQEGSTFKLENLSSRNLSIQAIPVSDNVGSVSLNLTGASNHSQTEGLGPYTLYGDAPGPDLMGRSWSAGIYQIQCQAFEGKKASGLAGTSLSYQFSLEETTAILSDQIILEDAERQSQLVILEDGQSYDLDLLSAQRLDIRAQLDPNNIASIQFELNGPVQISRVLNAPTPFRLFQNLNAPVWCAGDYVLKVTTFDQSEAQGNQVSEHNFTFSIQKKPKLDQLQLIDASQDQVISPVNGPLVLDLARLGSAFNFLAQSACTESVRFILRDSNGEEVINRLENVSPFCLAGDDGKGDFYSWVPENGVYTLEVKLFSEKREQGIASDPLLFQIEVVDAATAKLNDLALNSAEQPNTGINVFPNPNIGDHIEVEFEASFEGATQIIIYNQEGKVMLRKSWIQEGKENKISLDLPNAPWAQGVYILNVQNQSLGQKMTRIVQK